MVLQRSYPLSFSQEKILKKWGGVVPEIASRNHLEKLTPLIEEALRQNWFETSGYRPHRSDHTPWRFSVRFLQALNAAKSYSLILEKPILPVNHVYAHLEAVHLTPQVDISYPYFGLIVEWWQPSTSLFLPFRVRNFGDNER